MAGQYTPWIQDLTFPIESMRKNLDWVHVIAFDYYNPESTNNTSRVAALYDSTSDLNTDYGINTWIKSGFSSQKIVLGFPFYGYVWTLVSPKDSKIGVVGTGPSPKDYSYGTEAENEPFMSTDVKTKVSYAKERKLRGYVSWQVSYDWNSALSQAAAGERIPRNKIGSKNEDEGDGETRTLHIFTFDEMKEATNNFSVDNELGRRGYGPV
ncbi:hypothetical protein K7X08_022630 [Anisodus acutangulus]|uniref:GH18 domain-containing protein n=1 Tax=Anisodus acutangulus TaxID=402998 RepID=A0A9Q1MI47_9SOLA|nr:hypothetical protein K7X08_022630 [Anisodus acutangulus]